jgi:hypothetical protein
MTEQTLYTDLLKGSIIGRLSYANYIATGYADKIAKEDVNLQNKLSIFEEIKRFYGDMMEEEQEDELATLLKSDNNYATVEYLKKLDKDYVGYFLEILSNYRKEVETIYNEISDRVKIVIKDDGITEIKKAESKEDLSMAGKAWREIIVNDITAIYCVHENTYPKIQYELRGKTQQNIDTDIEYLVDRGMVEFKKKLTYPPKTKGYFEYRPTKEIQLSKSSVCNYFITLCLRRGQDFLRKIEKHNDRIAHEWYCDFGSEDNDELIAKVKIAIKSLRKVCQKIFLGRYFGSTEGKLLSYKELAEIYDCTPGYLNNEYSTCKEELKAKFFSNENQLTK